MSFPSVLTPPSHGNHTDHSDDDFVFPRSALGFLLSGRAGDETGKFDGRRVEQTPRTGDATLIPDESARVARIRAGDIAAFESVYREHYQSLCDFALIYLRQPDIVPDLVDEVFANLWTARAHWTPEKGIAPYLRGAVRNRVRNVIRDRMRSEATSATPAWTIGATPSATPAPDSAIELREEMAIVWRAVDQLPPGARLAVTLRWQQQLEISEIATHMGISAGAVRVHLTRALSRLRELLGDLFP